MNGFGQGGGVGGAVVGFARQDDGTLALRSIDPTSGAVRDLGVRLPPGTAQGTGLSARWDTRHGRALLLAQPSTGGAPGARAAGRAPPGPPGAFGFARPHARGRG